MSVLSVNKFNPDWEKVMVVDKDTANFLQSRDGDSLGDEIITVDFSDTKYGNLYDLKIHSWSNIYSYCLFDEDILRMDCDVVFLKEFTIPNRNIICGRPYNHINSYRNFKGSKNSIDLRYKGKAIEEELRFYEEIGLKEYTFKQEDICLGGAPIYIPARLTSYVTNEILNRIKEIESISNNPYANNDNFHAIKEEYVLADIANRTGGFGIFNTDMYRHGFIRKAEFAIDKPFESAESILEVPVFEKYLKPGI